MISVPSPQRRMDAAGEVATRPGWAGGSLHLGTGEFSGNRSQETNADRSFPEVHRAASRIVSLRRL